MSLKIGLLCTSWNSRDLGIGYSYPYNIGRIEYSYANVFFASMINNLFYAFGKQEELQYRAKGQIPNLQLSSIYFQADCRKVQRQ